MPLVESAERETSGAEKFNAEDRVSVFLQEKSFSKRQKRVYILSVKKGGVDSACMEIYPQPNPPPSLPLIRRPNINLHKTPSDRHPTHPHSQHILPSSPIHRKKKRYSVVEELRARMYRRRRHPTMTVRKYVSLPPPPPDPFFRAITGATNRGRWRGREEEFHHAKSEEYRRG